jgi:hypothetical protein
MQDAFNKLFLSVASQASRVSASMTKKATGTTKKATGTTKKATGKRTKANTEASAQGIAVDYVPSFGEDEYAEQKFVAKFIADKCTLAEPLTFPVYNNLADCKEKTNKQLYDSCNIPAASAASAASVPELNIASLTVPALKKELNKLGDYRTLDTKKDLQTRLAYALKTAAGRVN